MPHLVVRNKRIVRLGTLETGMLAGFLVLLFLLSAPLLQAAGKEGAEKGKTFALATDDTFTQIGVKDNQPAIFYLGSKGSKGNWASTPTGIPLMDHVFIRGERKEVKWEFSDFEQEDKNGTKVALHFKSSLPGLELSSVWQARPGPGPVEHYILITNKTADEIHIPMQKTFDVSFKAAKGSSLENWWVEKGNGTPSLIGTHREILYDGYYFYKPSTPYCQSPGLDMIPWISILDRTRMQGFYMGIEFSGQVCFNVSADGDPLVLGIKAGMDDTFVEYRSKIPAGGSYDTPICFIGCFNGDVDDGANILHRFVENHIRPPVPDPRYPLLVNNSWGSGMAVDEKLARKMIDDAASLGIEIFHVDAGWYKGVGHWHTSPEKFPEGLGPIVDYTHEKGMLFGLWIGWTQGGNPPQAGEKLSVSNPKMRTWFPYDLPDDWSPWDFTGETVCLGCDEARDWCLNDLRRVVRQYKLDLLEHDQRMIVEVCPRDSHRHLDNPADISYHATKGYYSVYDQLRKENPRLIFEDCVNGGRMVDFGVAKRVHYICFTDTYNPLSNRRGFYDASFPLPPGMCESYVMNDPGPTIDTFRAMLRSGMMGWCTIMCDTSAWTKEQHEAAGRQFEIYKSWIRPLINQGNLYHISKRPDGLSWDGIQYYDPKTGKGIVFAFRAAAPETGHIFKLKGLRARKTHRLWFEDKTSPEMVEKGSKLMSRGVSVRLKDPDTSELIYIEEK